MKRRKLLQGAAALALASRATGAEPEPGPLQLARRMGIGWNLGNALEAIGGETAWGNPATTQALIDAVKDAGFRSIRIPVAWHQYADAEGRIAAKWLARVAEVVGYARRASLHTLINVHWDGGWLQPTTARQKEANARLKNYWTQIATHFREHDETLLFAGTNEVMVENDYGTPTPEYRAVQNGFNQVFVDAVRATGGPNRQRLLVVQGFNTNIDHTLAFAVMPTDVVPGRLAMEVHYYDPYHFTLNEKSSIWQWGAGATDPKATEPWGDEAHLERQFAKMKAQFVDRGVPVMLGEYGVIKRQRAGAETYRRAWNRAVTRTALAHGLVPFYWDNGATGPNSMGLFHRVTATQAEPELIRAIVDAAKH